jgi:3-oxoacyl-[acyl-carrier protein] reductase
MDLGIAGRTALVTASSKGLGRGAALALAREGCNVVISARGTEALDRTADELRAEGAEVEAIAADVTDPSVPAELVRRTVERFGAVDILVPNAGGPPAARALDFSDEDLEQAINANLTTSIRLIREVVPHMRAKGWGRICCITSSSIKQPIRTLAMSNTARTGLWAWAKTASMDLFPDGITVNLACPGSHDTDRMKALKESGSFKGALGDPEDFGRVVAFLCSEPANFVSGTALQIDGATTVGLL